MTSWGQRWDNECENPGVEKTGTVAEPCGRAVDRVEGRREVQQNQISRVSCIGG